MMPEQGPIDALRDMNIGLFITFFWLLPMAAAVDEGIPLVGVVICAFFTAFFIGLQMWMPI